MWLLGESYHFCGWTWLARLTRKVYTYTIYQQYLPLSCLCCVCVCQTRRVSSFFFILPPAKTWFFFFFLTNPTNHERMLHSAHFFILECLGISIFFFSYLFFLSLFCFLNFNPALRASRICTRFPSPNYVYTYSAYVAIVIRLGRWKRARIQSVTLTGQIQTCLFFKYANLYMHRLFMDVFQFPIDIYSLYTYFLFGGKTAASLYYYYHFFLSLFSFPFFFFYLNAFLLSSFLRPAVIGLNERAVNAVDWGSLSLRLFVCF